MPNIYSNKSELPPPVPPTRRHGIPPIPPPRNESLREASVPKVPVREGSLRKVEGFDSENSARPDLKSHSHFAGHQLSLAVQEPQQPKSVLQSSVESEASALDVSRLTDSIDSVKSVFLENKDKVQENGLLLMADGSLILTYESGDFNKYKFWDKSGRLILDAQEEIDTQEMTFISVQDQMKENLVNSKYQKINVRLYVTERGSVEEYQKDVEIVFDKKTGHLLVTSTWDEKSKHVNVDSYVEGFQLRRTNAPITVDSDYSVTYSNKYDSNTMTQDQLLLLSKESQSVGVESLPDGKILVILQSANLKKYKLWDQSGMLVLQAQKSEEKDAVLEFKSLPESSFSIEDKGPVGCFKSKALNGMADHIVWDQRTGTLLHKGVYDKAKNTLTIDYVHSGLDEVYSNGLSADTKINFSEASRLSSSIKVSPNPAYPSLSRAEQAKVLQKAEC